MRPPGYEPGELSTAPLRDVISSKRLQRYYDFLRYANNSSIIFHFRLSSYSLLLKKFLSDDLHISNRMPNFAQRN